MTKPSYEELEAMLLRAIKLVGDLRSLTYAKWPIDKFVGDAEKLVYWNTQKEK